MNSVLESLWLEFFVLLRLRFACRARQGLTSQLLVYLFCTKKEKAQRSY